MNKNWDEIRGKAEREQNVPTKNFTHDGTQYALTGDHERAHSHFHEARAHLGKMKMINVNNLPIISGIKYFDDGSVATFKVVHGKEDIHIISPMTQLGGEVPPVPKKSVDEVEKIVPVIRSDDNLHWIACLSGTFEGPYYYFPNIHEIPATAFDDNVEADLDKQLISVGVDLIEDSIEPPGLFFIAQTGIIPDEYEWVDGDSGASEVISLLGQSSTTCGGAMTWYESLTGIHSNYNTQDLLVLGTDIGIPSYSSSTEDVRSRKYITKSGGSVPPPPWTDTSLVDSFYFDDPLSSFSEGDDWIRTIINESTVPWNSQYSVRIELDAYDNLAVCYRYHASSYYYHGARPFEPCSVPFPDYDVLTESITHQYCDYFRVDTSVFPLREESADAYPQYEGNGLKYYGPENMAAITGLMAAGVRQFDNFSDYMYCYVGPNSDNALSTTLFPSIDGLSRHEMSGVMGISDADLLGVLFQGEIFLGLIKYEIEA